MVESCFLLDKIFSLLFLPPKTARATMSHAFVPPHQVQNKKRRPLCDRGDIRHFSIRSRKKEIVSLFANLQL
jgi:hypothetical protein